MRRRCPGCGATLDRRALARRLQVCPGCGHHFRLDVGERVRLLADRGSFAARDTDVGAADPLGFHAITFLGDVNLAEPGALVGFAGPRVIEQTIGQRLPPGFQRAEFHLAHGMIDRVVPRAAVRATIARCLDLLAGPARLRA